MLEKFFEIISIVAGYAAAIYAWLMTFILQNPWCIIVAAIIIIITYGIIRKTYENRKWKKKYKKFIELKSEE